MKVYNYLALGLLSLLLFSCDKTQDLDRQQEQVVDNELRTPYSGEVQMKTLEALEYNTNDEARATITSNGYTVPSFNVTVLELLYKKNFVHWGVSGNGDSDAATVVDNFWSTRPNFDIKVNGVAVKQGNPTKVSMYCQIKSSFDVKKTFAWFALGGKLSDDKRYIDFTGETSPNTKIAGLVKDEEQIYRHLPIMTEILPFNKLLAPVGHPAKEVVTFKPRGAFIGLCFINQLGEDVKIESITVAKDNALFFEGKFDMHRGTDNRDLFAGANENSVPTKAQFVGVNEEFTYKVYKGNNKGYDLASTAGAVNTVKQTAPLFYLWGYPRTGTGSNKLKIKVAFRQSSRFTPTINEFVLDVPAGNGFQDGKAYRVPLLLEREPVFNPLSYVAEYDLAKMDNLDGNNHTLKFTETNKIKLKAGTNQVEEEYSNYVVGKDVGYFSFTQALRLFGYDAPDDGSTLDALYQTQLDAGTGDLPPKYKTINGKQYYLGGDGDWRSILPTYLKFSTENSDGNISWPAGTTLTRSSAGKVGNVDYPQIPLAVATVKDYMLLAENGITYALRFQGSEHESAWRYQQIKTNYTSSWWQSKYYYLVAKCVMLGQNSGKTINDIANEDFFNNSTEFVERKFPSCGYVDKWGLGLVPTYTLRWSSSFSASSGDVTVSLQTPRGTEIQWRPTNNDEIRLLAIRPFVLQ